ncbi:hypothetical protein EK904_005471 [Melospiza melodia maxima]|nr:hypothetical protein EK904_005471 [Melospiza melodia maxima]
MMVLLPCFEDLGGTAFTLEGPSAVHSPSISFPTWRDLEFPALGSDSTRSLLRALGISWPTDEQVMMWWWGREVSLEG